jgi:3-oxoacid CoA-transferase subunit B
MDLVSGAKRVVCVMTQTDKEGRSKLVEKCTLPLTGLQCVDRIITELGVLDVVRNSQETGFHIIELADGVSRNEMKGKIAGKLLD